MEVAEWPMLDLVITLQSDVVNLDISVPGQFCPDLPFCL